MFRFDNPHTHRVLYIGFKFNWHAYAFYNRASYDQMRTNSNKWFNKKMIEIDIVHLAVRRYSHRLCIRTLVYLVCFLVFIYNKHQVRRMCTHANTHLMYTLELLYLCCCWTKYTKQRERESIKCWPIEVSR